jgi:Stage II sporulation protein M
VDASSYALAHGVRRTRETLAGWQQHPWPAIRGWLVGSLAASVLLLVAIWVVSLVSSAHGFVSLRHPPFGVGQPRDVVRILGHNMLVLMLHAMACVAGFIAGSSLPLQAAHRTGLSRRIHEGGRRAAITFVVCATGFSLSLQAYSLGTNVARVASGLHASSALLLLGLLPHALPELVALFLPLAAWIIASRRGQWEQLLAATLVTVAFAVPMLVITAVWEVYVAPHLLGAIFSYG